MSLWKEYKQPASVEDAIRDLLKADGKGQVLAGGTDLILELRQGQIPSLGTAVDVCAIPELQTIALVGDEVILGAAVTYAAILDSPLLAMHAPCLKDASALIGGPQVRRVATIGGNVGNALPAADGTQALLALQAQAQLASPQGRCWLPIEELFTGPGEPKFDRSQEVLVAFRFMKRQVGEGSALRRVRRPQGVAIATLNFAAWLRLDRDGRVSAARLAMGPSGPCPRRARKAEKTLIGRQIDEKTINEVAKSLLAEVSLRSSIHRATAEYRQLLASGLLKQVLQLAQERAALEGDGS